MQSKCSVGKEIMLICHVETNLVFLPVVRQDPFRVGLDQNLLLADLLSFQNGMIQIQTNLGLVLKYNWEHPCQFSLRNIKNYGIYGGKSQAIGYFCTPFIFMHY